MRAVRLARELTISPARPKQTVRPRMPTPMHDAVHVVQVPGCGYGLAARRQISCGEIIFREAPFAVLRAAAFQEAFLHDPELRALASGAKREDSQFGDEQWWPTAARASDAIIQRFAHLEFCSQRAR